MDQIATQLLIPLTPLPGNGLPEGLKGATVTTKDGRKLRAAYATVSYTHLTLPTILRV